MSSTKFADRVNSITPSTTLSINQQAKDLKASGVDIISFSVGEPKFDVPKHILDAGKKAFDDNKLQYTAAGGIKELRTAVVERYNKNWGSDYKWQNTIITVGAKHGLFNLAFVLFSPGDEIIVPVPYWLSYPEINTMNEARNVYLPLSVEEDMILTAERLASVITSKTRAVIVNTPSNPSGAVIPRGELEKIAALAIEKDFYIIFDECYEKFVFQGEPHFCLAACDSKVREKTLLVNSASKTYGLTGLRIGYITGPLDIINKMDEVQSHQTSNPCSIAQWTALAALKGDQNFLDALLMQYRERADFMYEEFRAIGGIKVFKPKGAFYIFPDVSSLIKKGGFRNDLEFADRLIREAHITAVPGSCFGMEGYLRFSFVEDIETVKEGVQRFKEFARAFI
jgi:aspartate aminotransferase